MQRVAFSLGVTVLLVGLVGGSPTGQVVAPVERSDPSLTVGAKSAKVDINRAAREEIGRLPGMTTALVDRIIQNRPYRKLDELISKKVMGRKQFAEIREYVVARPGGM
jgi:DNA uptake protein ComE-like DNA-binding protein